MKYRIGVECGQKWWRLRSWRHRSLFRWLTTTVFLEVEYDTFFGIYFPTKKTKAIKRGFAIGPIMVYKKGL